MKRLSRSQSRGAGARAGNSAPWEPYRRSWSWSQRAGNSAPNQLPNELWSSKPNGSALREQA